MLHICEVGFLINIVYYSPHGTKTQRVTLDSVDSLTNCMHSAFLIDRFDFNQLILFTCKQLMLEV